MEAVEASQPSTFLYGTVIREKPLQIQVDQKTILPESFLVLTNNVRDYELMIEVDHETEEEVEHFHTYKGEKMVQVKNGLKAGEKIILIKQKGGQSYIVLDRIMEDE